MLTSDPRLGPGAVDHPACAQPTVTEDQLKGVFVKFMDPTMTEEECKERILVATNFIERGFAFVDLDSQENVARAVSASR